MKKVIWSIIVLAVAAAIGWQVWKKVEAAKTKPEQTKRGGAKVAVEVVPVARRPMRDVREFMGDLEAWNRVDIAARIGGRLERLHVHIGDTVAPGDLLAELDAAEYEQALNEALKELAVSRTNVEQARLEVDLARDAARQQFAQAKAAVESTRASVAEAKLAIEAARRELTRAEALREKGVASVEELDRARDTVISQQARLKALEADVTRGEAAVKAAEVRLSPVQEEAWKAQVRHAEDVVAQRETAVEAARLRLTYTKVLAGWAGDGNRVVGERRVDEGAMLSANQPLVTVLQLDPIRAVVYVTEREYARLKLGDAAELTTDAFPDERFVGTVSRIAPRLDPASREARVELQVANGEGRLKPGMFVRVRMTFEMHDAATAVPLSALVRRGEQRGVFLADREAGTARFVPVKVGIADGGWVEIVEPAIDGLVVSLGQHLLTDGTAVVVHEAPGQAETQP